ncbi:MAG: DUF2953 domain-containing protein [Clostridiales bacterium]|nr:DUF2953 domain-containing protein [Clostridiales bacterium]
MLHILWLIIKFILIALGIVCALLLSVLLLILFCPVRYFIQGSKPEEDGMSELKGQVRVSWLFRGITFRFFYENKKAGTDFRILGISPDKFRRRKKKVSVKEEKAEEKTFPAEKSLFEDEKILEKKIPEEKMSGENLSGDEKISSSEKIPSVIEEKEETGKSKVQEETDREKTEEISKKKLEKKKPGLLKRFMEKIKSIPSKIRKIRLTIKRTCVKIEWWKRFFFNPRIKEAISFCWKDIKKLIRHILPIKVEGNVTFGFEDPSITGRIVALLGMTIPFHKNCIQIMPLFQTDRNILEGTIKMKGRIYGVVLVKTAAEIYFNKNVKYMINRWKHKEV